ncbi:MAG: diacylglycerol/lipid kinase family protein [Rudaea sp.]
MAANARQHREIARELKRARVKHDKLLNKVAKARGKFRARLSKLQGLEQQMIALQQETQPSIESSGNGSSTSPLKPIRFILNPSSGRSPGDPNALQDLFGVLRARGIEPRLGIKTSGKAAREMAREAADNGEEIVIVGGGDGTIEDVASQLVHTQTALAILPLGTMNNLARSLGIPLELDAAADLIAGGITRRIDIGHVRAQEKKQKEFFMETAGVGLTAIAFPAGQAAKKGRLDGMPDYLRGLADSRPQPTEISLDGGPAFLVNTQLITISNAPLIGINFMIAPEAAMDDGLFDIAVYEEMSKRDILGYFVAITNGRPTDNPKIKRYRAKQIQVHAPHGEPVHADKDEIKKAREWLIEVIPQALLVIAGKQAALEVPVPSAPAAAEAGRA